jgi:hypothetical protein
MLWAIVLVFLLNVYHREAIHTADMQGALRVLSDFHREFHRANAVPHEAYIRSLRELQKRHPYSKPIHWYCADVESAGQSRHGVADEKAVRETASDPSRP